jgi:hypothetical protein
MNKLRVRPRIKRFTTTPPEVILNRFSKLLDTGEFPVNGKIVQHNVIVKIAKNEQHYWSPELHVAVEKYEAFASGDENEGKTIIRGNIGPTSTVWTMFMFFYVLVGVLGSFGGMYGLSQWTLGMTPWAFWFLGLALVILAGIWMAIRIGQKLGNEQAHILMAFIEKAQESDEGET